MLKSTCGQQWKCWFWHKPTQWRFRPATACRLTEMGFSASSMKSGRTNQRPNGYIVVSKVALLRLIGIWMSLEDFNCPHFKHTPPPLSSHALNPPKSKKRSVEMPAAFVTLWVSPPPRRSSKVSITPHLQRTKIRKWTKKASSGLGSRNFNTIWNLNIVEKHIKY